MESHSESVLAKHIEEGNAEYTYYLTIHTNDTHTTMFGVKITLLLDENFYCGESGALFCDKGSAEVFLSFLSEHLVTPSNLPYVIEDALSF